MQKAKLDILENIPDIEMFGVISESDELPDVVPIPGNKWASNKFILLVSIIGLGVVIIAGGVWFYFIKSVPLPRKETIIVSSNGNSNKESEEASKPAGEVPENTSISVPAAPLAEKVTTIYFKDFIIDLKDTSGKSKILICDIAIDVSENQDAAKLVNDADVRDIIYRTAKGKSAVALRSLEERKRLKDEMARELGKILGEGIVKNVYFTNYIIM
jgi:flagellar basal body-associated protein FliL